MADDSDVALFHYSSNLSGKHKPIGINFHYNDAGITVESMPVSMSEFKDRIDLQGKVLEILLSGAKKVREIAELSEASENTIRVILNKLKKKGKIINTDRGEYGILSSEIPE